MCDLEIIHPYIGSRIVLNKTIIDRIVEYPSTTINRCGRSLILMLRENVRGLDTSGYLNNALFNVLFPEKSEDVLVLDEKSYTRLTTQFAHEASYVNSQLRCIEKEVYRNYRNNSIHIIDFLRNTIVNLSTKEIIGNDTIPLEMVLDNNILYVLLDRKILKKINIVTGEVKEDDLCYLLEKKFNKKLNFLRFGLDHFLYMTVSYECQKMYRRKYGFTNLGNGDARYILDLQGNEIVISKISLLQSSRLRCVDGYRALLGFHIDDDWESVIVQKEFKSGWDEICYTDILVDKCEFLTDMVIIKTKNNERYIILCDTKTDRLEIYNSFYEIPYLYNKFPKNHLLMTSLTDDIHRICCGIKKDHKSKQAVLI